MAGKRKTAEVDRRDQAPAQREPVLLSRGVYSLYKSPDGGIHLAYRTEDMTEDGHIVLPPMMVRMAEAAAEGRGPFGKLAAMVGGMAGGPDAV